MIIGKNNAHFIQQCLESVLKQDPQPFEVVYVNDGSTDQTQQKLEALAQNEKKLKVITTEGVGISKARNLGNAAAQGDFIAILDSDDTFLPGALAAYLKQLELLNSDLIYAECVYVSPAGKNLGLRKYASFSNNQNFAYAIMAYPRVPFKHSAIIYKKSLLKTLGGYDESLHQKVDIDLMLKFLLIGNIRVSRLEYAVANHTRHRSQISQKRVQPLTIWYSLIKKYEHHFVKQVLLITCRTVSEIMKALLELF